MDAILGYELGEIDAQAAFTSEFVLDVSVPLQDVVNMQEMERRIMDARPGMYIKYLPYRFDAETGRKLVGGCYLFDTWENVLDYDHWTTNVFEVGDSKEKFWSRAMFQDIKSWKWRVVGAFNFTLPDKHALGRLQRWVYTGENADRLLKEVYPALKDEARNQGAAAVWVLHQPDEKMIAILTVAGKSAGRDPVAAARESVTRLEREDSLGALLPAQLLAENVLDRTSLFLSQWMPVSRLAGGAPQCTPNFPVLPAITVEPQQI